MSSAVQEQLAPHLARFAALVRRPAAEIPLAEASLEIARLEYPDLDAQAYLRRLDELGKAAVKALPGTGVPARERAMALSRFLAVEQGYHGDATQAVSPQNSYLSDVMDRRSGLPVVLSVIYMEIGKCIGLPLVGVGMPIHFLVRIQDEEPAIYIDPFNKGALLDEEGCRRLLEEVSRGELDLQPEFLRPLTTPRILERILQNLKIIHLQQQDNQRARRIIDLILILRPGAATEIRDRGMLAYAALLFEQAAEDLDRYVSLKPRAKDASAIRGQLQSLRRLLPSRN